MLGRIHYNETATNMVLIASRPSRRRDGFTLIELLVVLAILGLIAAIAVPQVLDYLGRARTDTTRINIENIGGALDLYRLDVGRYPSGDQGLEALVRRPPGVENWNGRYVKKTDSLIDPWGNAYLYRFPGEHGDYDLYSLGADAAEGGEDEDQDVVSW